MKATWTVKLDGEVVDVDVVDKGRSGNTVISAATNFDVVVDGRKHPVEVLVEFDPPPVIP